MLLASSRPGNTVQCFFPPFLRETVKLEALLPAKGVSCPACCLITYLGRGNRSRAGDEGGAEGSFCPLKQGKY